MEPTKVVVVAAAANLQSAARESAELTAKIQVPLREDGEEFQFESAAQFQASAGKLGFQESSGLVAGCRSLARPCHDGMPLASPPPTSFNWKGRRVEQPGNWLQLLDAATALARAEFFPIHAIAEPESLLHSKGFLFLIMESLAGELAGWLACGRIKQQPVVYVALALPRSREAVRRLDFARFEPCQQPDKPAKPHPIRSEPSQRK